MIAKLSIALLLAAQLSPSSTQPPVAEPTSKVGELSPLHGDGHLLPGWSNRTLYAQASVIQTDAHASDLLARRFMRELDQAFVDLATGRPKVSVPRKLSELDYQILKISDALKEAETLSAATIASSWDRIFLQRLQDDIRVAHQDLVVSRIFFERQWEQARLRARATPARP